jgi:hypothetical protein
LRNSGAGVPRLTAYVAGLDVLIHSASSLGLAVSGGLGKELFEILEQIRSRYEQLRDLSVHVLDGFRFPLVSLQDLQELFVYFGLLRKAVLHERQSN